MFLRGSFRITKYHRLGWRHGNIVKSLTYRHILVVDDTITFITVALRQAKS